jgi:hypothetical protein
MTKTSLLRIAAGIALTATLGFTTKTAMEAKTLCAGFLPENNMKIPVGLFSSGGLSQQQFNDVLDRLEKIYRDDVAALGDTLQINRRWQDATVNASAMRSGNTEVLNMYGGLARHPTITIEGFALVACHEFGHHHGGAPKISDWFSGDWATNEGGADYYATLKCLRRFFAEDDNAAIVAAANIDPVAKTSCEAQFSDQKDQLVCLRESMAGQSVANLFQAMRKEQTPPSYGTPDKSQVSETNDDHPATQCRLDTMFAGFSCQAKENETLSNSDYRQGSCYTPHDQVGARPRCWFAP